MSKLPSVYREVTQQDIISFYNDNGIKASCTLCHHNEFDIPLMNKSTALDLFHAAAGAHVLPSQEYVRPFVLHDEVLGDDIATYPLTCKRCGNVRLLNAENVLDWKELKAKQVQEGDHE
ncbi:hypothetical protein ACET92_19685 [Aeromonas veronii]|uniref:hypothetical protein n=1 Tax=Aeromonas rivipollensis TaxID=948519 RepID=UPI0038D14F7D